MMLQIDIYLKCVKLLAGLDNLVSFCKSLVHNH